MKKVYSLTTEVSIEHGYLYGSEFRKIFSQTGVSWTIEESWLNRSTTFEINILSDKSDYEYIKDRIINELGLEIKELTDE